MPKKHLIKASFLLEAGWLPIPRPKSEDAVESAQTQPFGRILARVFVTMRSDARRFNVHTDIRVMKINKKQIKLRHFIQEPGLKYKV